MSARDARIDRYIEAAPEFAQPILAELRTRIHAAVPGLEETMKWSSPHFMYGGKLFFGMVAFKQHCSFGFWHAMMRGQDSSLEGMGRYKPASVKDLPGKAEFSKLAKEAKRLADDGVKAPPKPKAPRVELATPADLEAALARNKKARATFDAFSYSARKEYIVWITEAKRPETRTARVAQAVEWMAEGKKRHWKYETC
jgi:uncharacterized protein YdeI (YjbR/CyaY-like superfamily)